ncbi:MAG: hypothetical protein ACREQ5_00935 [Candidatus Dormibacteria bacterium]
MTQPLPLEGLFELTPAITKQLVKRPTATAPPAATNPSDGGTVRLDLPRWDTAWKIRTRRGGWPRIDPKTGKVLKHRVVWDALSGNARVHYTQRHIATKVVITAVVDAATRAGLEPCDYMEVVLVWAPGHNRATDEDNRWALLKACCDGLARGPRKDLPGLHLVPDDDSRHMRKSVRIDPPPAPPALYLEIQLTSSRP